MNSFDFPSKINYTNFTSFTFFTQYMVKVVICYILVAIIAGGGIRFAFFMLWPVFGKYKKAPYVPSFDYHLNLIKKNLKLRKWAKIVDLWCGDGKALRFFSKNFWLKGEGYDINAAALRYGKILNRFHKEKNVKLIKANFEKAELKKYDYIYIYLFPNQLAEIEKRVFSNISDQAIIISNSFQFGKHKPFKTIKNNKGKDSIFLYKKII